MGTQRSIRFQRQDACLQGRGAPPRPYVLVVRPHFIDRSGRLRSPLLAYFTQEITKWI